MIQCSIIVCIICIVYLFMNSNLEFFDYFLYLSSFIYLDSILLIYPVFCRINICLLLFINQTICSKIDILSRIRTVLVITHKLKELGFRYSYLHVIRFSLISTEVSRDQTYVVINQSLHQMQLIFFVD